MKTITAAVKFKKKRITQTLNCSPVHKIVKLFAECEGGDILLRTNRCKDVRNALK